MPHRRHNLLGTVGTCLAYFRAYKARQYPCLASFCCFIYAYKMLHQAVMEYYIHNVEIALDVRCLATAELQKYRGLLRLCCTGINNIASTSTANNNLCTIVRYARLQPDEMLNKLLLKIQ